MPKTDTTIRIEVFRPGTFKPMEGDAISYSAADLTDLVTAYDPEVAPAPIVVGHPSTDDPAFGWATGFEYDADKGLLFADLGEIQPAFSEAVKAGHYKKVSLQFFRPSSPNNPKPGNWYPKHIGFLGAAAPAVSGLKPVQFSEAGDDEVATFEASFGEAGFENTASILRSIRDWIIGKDGLEVADQVISSYRLDWLADTEIKPITPKFPSYVEPQPKDTDMTAEEIAAEKKALKAREDKLTAGEASFAEADARRRSTENESFAEALVADCKLLPASKASVVTFLDALPVDQDVSFSEGESIPLADAFKKILSDQPKVVSFGSTDLGDDPDDAVKDPKKIASFATAYQKTQADAGINISISEAVEHVTKGQAK